MTEDEMLLGFFQYSHLPPHLQEVSRRFHDVALDVFNLPPSYERTAGMRKLLEAKDCAVRAKLVGKPRT